MSKTFAAVTGISLLLTAVTVHLLQKYIPLAFSDALIYCRSIAEVSVMQISPLIYRTIIGIMSIWGTISLTRLLFIIAKVRYLTRQSRKLPRQTGNVQAVLNSLGSNLDIRVIPGDVPHAFCAGILHPKVYISEPLLRDFHPDELLAVLSHERQHLLRGDTRKILFLSFLSSLFPFVPLIKELVSVYRLEAEAEADRAALAVLPGREPLLSAFRRMLHSPETYAYLHTAPAFSGTEALEARLHSLIHNRPAHYPLPGTSIILSALFIGCMMFGIALPVQATTVSVNTVKDIHCTNEAMCTFKCPSNIPLYTPAFVTIAK